jgi:hypothetical protein
MNYDPRPSIVGRAIIYTGVAACILYIILQAIELINL